ncbi:tRNA (guanosine(37)-N1)-methyltransferase TrmD [bacterium]|nr:tRNA (guanosine(37)-N1)-methyltransferase TrmD [bacterium]
MQVDILTLFPEMIQNACSHSIISRAISDNLVSVNAINPRDFTHSKHKKVDDTPYGGGAGMVLMCQPFLDALASVNRLDNSQTIILTPQGEPFNNSMAKEFAKKDQLIMICGHYEGFDERIRTLSNAKEVSIGDFVLTGGELPALCILDSTIRFIDGVLGKIASADYDSFEDGLLEYPQYTKPREYCGLKVPDVLLNGNHAEIAAWRKEQQILKTQKMRPDLWNKYTQNN